MPYRYSYSYHCPDTHSRCLSLSPPQADARRGVPSVNAHFGNKLAILAGDFMLARASVSLARLRSVEAVELISTSIEHLVKGEIMQMRPGAAAATAAAASKSEFKDKASEARHFALLEYLHKNYYKTGSLMANSCKAAAVLDNQPADVCDAAFNYGKHVGLAFQLVDDVLDFEGDLATLGKPPLADLRSGLATAPVLLACDDFPDEMGALIARRFKVRVSLRCGLCEGCPAAC